MANKQKPLTPTQQAAVVRVREQKQVWLEAKARIAEEARKWTAERLAEQEMAYALTIRAARNAGVPKVRIRTEGMDTTDAHTLDRWLAKTEGIAAAMTTADVFTLDDDGNVTVRYPGFPTTSKAEDYPEVLEGIVKRNGSFWLVVDDPGTTAGEFGELPGHLTWEITHGTLPAALDEWWNAR